LVAVKLRIDDRWPSWNTHTATPKVALREAALRISALTGMIRLPVISKKARNVTAAMTSNAAVR
jgi:hypothetical protein